MHRLILFFIPFLVLSSCQSQRIYPKNFESTKEIKRPEDAMLFDFINNTVVGEYGDKFQVKRYWYSGEDPYAVFYEASNLAIDDINALWEYSGPVPEEFKETLHLPSGDLNYVSYIKVKIGKYDGHMLISKEYKSVNLIAKCQ